jgi:hypothetical protein
LFRAILLLTEKTGCWRDGTFFFFLSHFSFFFDTQMTFDSPHHSFWCPFPLYTTSPENSPLETQFGTAETATTNGNFFSFIPQPGAKQYDRYPMMGKPILAALPCYLFVSLALFSFLSCREKTKQNSNCSKKNEHTMSLDRYLWVCAENCLDRCRIGWKRFFFFCRILFEFELWPFDPFFWCLYIFWPSRVFLMTRYAEMRCRLQVGEATPWVLLIRQYWLVESLPRPWHVIFRAAPTHAILQHLHQLDLSKGTFHT